MNNKTLNEIYSNDFGISTEILNLAKDAEESAKAFFEGIDEIAAFNQAKVLSAFSRARVSYAHLGDTTGYGYDDIGRDTLDKIFADVFGAECAYVRHNIVSGTQALASCLFGILRPGDTICSVVGGPYDTMEEVIGIRGDGDYGSLKDLGVSYRQIDLLPSGEVDYNKIMSTFSENEIKLALIQRSRGYAWRDSLSIDSIKKIISSIKKVSPNTVCMVDNCYGEFVEKSEPTQVGADLMAGSLIKNPGGGLALSGGYIAGKTEYVEKAACRLTAPGLGRELGATLGQNRTMYQGFFNAPHAVAQSIKTAIFGAFMFSKMGYEVCPLPDSKRSDIIQSIKFNNPEHLIAFCRAIQSGSPIDSFVSPEPWDMPGYGDPVIMAAGTFVQGASIELSADAPICEPYIAYMQGGLIYSAAKIGILKAADAVLKIDNNK